MAKQKLNVNKIVNIYKFKKSVPLWFINIVSRLMVVERGKYIFFIIVTY